MWRKEMIVCIRAGDDDSDATPPQTTSAKNTSLEEVLVPKGSPSSIDGGLHVVIVMDALEVFSTEPLQWVLNHFVRSGYTITLLGVMPWLPLPRSCKTWLGVWTFDVEDLSALKWKAGLKNDYKHRKIQSIVELCEEKGVILCMKVAMGHPLKLVILDQTTSLHATFVVIDRHLKKHKAFFAERLPSTVALMNDDGGVDILKIQSRNDHSDPTPEESPASILPPAEVILSEQLSELFSGAESLEKRIKPK